MRYHVPQFQIATLAGRVQDRLWSKIGGLPWGLPQELWPRCCGKPQKFLAQMLHEPPMLDLGSAGAVLHLFQCGECGGINHMDEGLAAFLVERSILGSGLVRVEGCDEPTHYSNGLVGEAWIVGWEERDDGIPAERLADFFEERRYWKLMEDFPKIEWYGGREATKFGGSPRWTGNGPMGFPPPPFEFLFQFDDYLFVDGDLPSPDAVGCPVIMCEEGHRQTKLEPKVENLRPNAPWFIMHEIGTKYYYFEYANLASDGTAYVFIDRSRHPHRVYWFYNR